jgi:hypothetical protein
MLHDVDDPWTRTLEVFTATETYIFSILVHILFLVRPQTSDVGHLLRLQLRASGIRFKLLLMNLSGGV